jgi:hypothetical protein
LGINIQSTRDAGGISGDEEGLRAVDERFAKVRDFRDKLPLSLTVITDVSYLMIVLVFEMILGFMSQCVSHFPGSICMN